MTGSERILWALNDVSDELVEQAGHRRHHLFARLAALAACVALLAVSFYPFLRGMNQNGGDGDAKGIVLGEDGGASYAVWEDENNTMTDRLELPWPITDGMAGELVCTLADGGEVYQYAPLAGRTGDGPAAVRLLKEGNNWQYLLFAGFPDPEGEALLEVYGIREASDIVQLTAGDTALEPEGLYTALADASGITGKEYAQLVVAGADSPEAEEALVEESRQGFARLKLVTDLGIVAWPEYYPVTGYLSWGEKYYPVGTGLLG